MVVPFSGGCACGALRVVQRDIFAKEGLTCRDSKE